MASRGIKSWDSVYFTAVIFAVALEGVAALLSLALIAVASASATIEFRKTRRRIPRMVAIVGWTFTAYQLFAVVVMGR